jgi:hypothetical protein
MCKRSLNLRFDEIQATPKNSSEVPVGPTTRLMVKRFKKVFNWFIQDTWAKVNFKKILNNKVHAFINLIHVQEGFVGGHSDIKKKIELRRLKSVSFDLSLFFWS